MSFTQTPYTPSMIKLLIALSLTLLGVINKADDQRPLVNDLDSQLKNLSWRVVNDTVMGGRSQGNLDVAPNKLTFTGVTNTNGGGFASIRTVPQKLNLNDASKIAIRLRGDGRTYTFRLASNKPRISYWLNFQTKNNTWQEIELPFASFWPNWRGRKLHAPRISATDITALGFMIYDGQNGPFRLEVDWITAK